MNQTAPRHKPLPGDLAIWFFIMAELAVFGILFVGFNVTRVRYPEVFSEGFTHLNRLAGLINTIALITSSYFVANAVHAVRENRPAEGTRWLWGALLAATVYVIVKTVEYSEAFGAGVGLSTNIFYTFYFLLTFFHFAHVLLGMVILGVLAVHCGQGRYSPDDHFGLSSGASYWHMVDLVWVVLFPTVYVLH